MSSKSIRVVLFKLSLAWRNLSQRRSQFLTALAAISFAVFLMFSQIGFQNAMLDSNVAFLRAFNADLVMVNKRRYVSLIEETFDRSRLYQARGFEGVDAAYPLHITMGSWRTYGSRNERPIRVFGFRPDHPVFRSPEIQAQQRALTTPNTVLSDRKSRKEYGALQPGGTGELSNVKVNIVGTFEMGADFVTDGNLMMSDQSFLKIFAAQPSGFEAKLRPSLQEVDMGLLKVAAGTDRDFWARHDHWFFGWDCSGLQHHLHQHCRQPTPVWNVESHWPFHCLSVQYCIAAIYYFGSAGLFPRILLEYPVLSDDFQRHRADLSNDPWHGQPGTGFDPVYVHRLWIVRCPKTARARSGGCVFAKILNA
jgi:hypothetical protein